MPLTKSTVDYRHDALNDEFLTSGRALVKVGKNKLRLINDVLFQSPSSN